MESAYLQAHGIDNFVSNLTKINKKKKAGLPLQPTIQPDKRTIRSNSGTIRSKKDAGSRRLVDILPMEKFSAPADAFTYGHKKRESSQTPNLN